MSLVTTIMDIPTATLLSTSPRALTVSQGARTATWTPMASFRSSTTSATPRASGSKPQIYPKPLWPPPLRPMWYLRSKPSMSPKRLFWTLEEIKSNKCITTGNKLHLEAMD